jgi:hypothetical protein
MANFDRSSLRSPEMMTANGFRVALVYDEGPAPGQATIGVLVRCPPELIGRVPGCTAYLWSGSQRFELGEFDSDGKAIGFLPAGVEVTFADFATEGAKLEAPRFPEDHL